jgi:hypothetical protein
MLIRTAYAVPNATARWLHIFLSGEASWWMLTTRTRKVEPKNKEGVRSTMSPRRVLELSAPP